MQLHHLHRESPRAQTAPVNGAVSQAMPAPSPVSARLAAPDMAAQTCVIAGMLAALWVAISPWFLTFQAHGGNATANDLIVGLAVLVALGLAAYAGRGRTNLLTAGALAGVWLIISPFILDAKFPITASMYWSNVWSGAIIFVLVLGALALGRPDTAR
jgi:hypothetical protein